MSTFENTNSSVEHLQKGTRVKCYLETVDFVIISYHSHNFWEFLSNRWGFFYGSEVHLLLILFSKRKYESKKSINSQPDRSMRHIGTCLPHDIRDEWILQFSLPLADTVGTKRFVRGNQRCSLFQKLGNISLIFVTFMTMFEVFKVTRRHRKERKERKK